MANRTKAFTLTVALSFSLCSVTSNFAYSGKTNSDAVENTEKTPLFQRLFPTTWERVNDYRKKKEEETTQNEPKKDEQKQDKTYSVKNLKQKLQKACVNYGVEILKTVVADTSDPVAGSCACQELTNLKKLSYPCFKKEKDDDETTQWVWLWYPHYRTDKPRHEEQIRFWCAIEEKSLQRKKTAEADEAVLLAQVKSLANSYQKVLTVLAAHK